MSGEYVHEGMTEVSWVPTIASIAAPTVAELNAGTKISSYLTKDGLKVPQTQNMVDNSSLAETFDAQVVGSWGGQLELTMKRTTTDTAWALFDYGENGYLVIRRGLAVATAWTAAQKAEVYPAEAHKPVPNDTAANAQATFKVALAVTAEPNLAAVVAA